MHEFGLAEQISAAVQKRAAGRRVRSVRVRVGALRQVNPQALASAFALVTAGTPLEDALLELIVVPARSRCGACNEVSTSIARVTACPTCPSGEMELLSGNELVLEAIIPERQGRSGRNPAVPAHGIPPTVGRTLLRPSFRQPVHGQAFPDWREGQITPHPLW